MNLELTEALFLEGRITEVNTLGESFPYGLEILISNNGEEKTLELEDYHKEDCCEDVAVDWDEIPQQSLEDLVGLEVNSITLTKLEDGGFLLNVFHSPLENAALPEELWQNKTSVYVGCHNIQNGWYGTDLSVTATYGDQSIKIEDLEFSFEEID